MSLSWIRIASVSLKSNDPAGSWYFFSIALSTQVKFDRRSFSGEILMAIFGTYIPQAPINDLLADSVKDPIPQGDYLVTAFGDRDKGILGNHAHSPCHWLAVKSRDP